MWRKIGFSSALVLLTIWLGYFAQREDFAALIGAYSLFFLLYWLAANRFQQQDLQLAIGLGILLRAILLFSLPNLSDDFYRFVWDGQLIINGLNPFDHLPGYFIEHQILTESLTLELYEKLNSKLYFTIYPPVAQAVFALACWIFPNSIFGSMVVIKLILLLGEIGSIVLIIKLLKRFKLPEKNILLYALNPLIIFEIIGNLHFEGLMILFTLLSLYLIISNRWVFSALTIALAIASKLLPLLFLPFLIARLGFKKSLVYFLILGIALLLLFTPLLNSFFFNHFGESLNLYFRQFEFNASIYYLVSWIGFQIKGYNMVADIGPILAIFTFGSIITLAIVKRNKVPPDWRTSWATLTESWLFAISIYLLFATTVHPWYVTVPVALSVFTKWRFALIWSGVAWLSYSHYWGGGAQENYWLIGVEYVILLGFLLLEITKKQMVIPSDQ